MNTTVYTGILLALFVLQIFLSLRPVAVAVKCIPTMLVLTTMTGSFLAYVLSGFTNWGWLIFLLLEAGTFIPIALAAMLGAIVKKTRK